MEFFSEIYCTWPSLVKQNTANANSLYRWLWTWLFQWKCLLHWAEVPLGLRLGRRPHVSVLCGSDRWLCLLNSPSCLCAVKWVFSLSPVPSTCPGLKMEKCQACCNSVYRSGCCRSVVKLCSTLCDLMACSMPGFPVLHYLPEFAQTHVH